jgi:F-type H+-transporting ATPase subunit b
MQQPALPVPVEAHTVAHAEADHGPTLLGLGAEGWVYVSITIFFVLAIFVAKAHRTILAKLDAQIAETRKELDEAQRVRAEAEALLRETEARRAEVESDAAAMLANARAEAQDLIAKAEREGEAMVARRRKMAEDQIKAAEREALAALRNEAAAAATAASRRLIASTHGETADRALADKVIASL